jgi:hypothetical protein
MTPPPQSTVSFRSEVEDGNEPITAVQRSYLETLRGDTRESFDENLTKAAASKKIDELWQRSPRLTGQ